MTKRLMVCAVMLCGISMAAFVPLNNANFENPVLADGNYVFDVDHSLNNYGWSLDTPDRTWMIYNPSGSDPMQAAEGSNWMQLTRAGSTTQISQITSGYQIEANTVYRVSIDIAQRATWGSDTFVYCNLYAAKNGAQNRTSGYTLHTSGLNYFTNDNNWQTFTFDWDSTGSLLVGQNFDIAIGGKTMIDNVRLEIVPEPATIALLGAGVLFSGIRKRKRI